MDENIHASEILPAFEGVLEPGTEPSAAPDRSPEFLLGSLAQLHTAG